MCTKNTKIQKATKKQQNIQHKIQQNNIKK